jgi:hypothetical protein
MGISVLLKEQLYDSFMSYFAILLVEMLVYYLAFRLEFHLSNTQNLIS